MALFLLFCGSSSVFLSVWSSICFTGKTFSLTSTIYLSLYYDYYPFIIVSDMNGASVTKGPSVFSTS